MLLLLLATAASAISDSNSTNTRITEYVPYGAALRSVTSAQPRSWLEMRALCNAEHPGHFLAMLSEPPAAAAAAQCPVGSAVPLGLVRLPAGDFAWDNVGDLAHRPVSSEEIARLRLGSVPGEGAYSSALWPDLQQLTLTSGDEPAFLCAVCELSHRLDVVTRPVYPAHEATLYAYHLQLVSNRALDDLASIAQGSVGATELIGDLAAAFNVTQQSLRWHGTELDAARKAVVHVYYEPAPAAGDAMDWYPYRHWNNQYLDHVAIPGYQLTSIALSTECLKDKNVLMNVKKKTYLTGYIDVAVDDSKYYMKLKTRECAWDEPSKAAAWTPWITWDVMWGITTNSPFSDFSTLIKLRGDNFTKMLRNYDVCLLFNLDNQDKGLVTVLPLRTLVSLCNSYMLVHLKDLSVFDLLSMTIPVRVARLLTRVTLPAGQSIEVARSRLVNVVVGDPAADPAAGLAVALAGEEVVVTSLTRSTANTPPLDANFVVTASDAVVTSARRLAIATCAAHLEPPGSAPRYDDSIEAWMAIVQVAFTRDDADAAAADADFVDVAFTPVFASATLRGKCAERDLDTDEWRTDSCRVLRSLRAQRMVCRCAVRLREPGLSTGVFLVYGFDASLATYLADNRTLIIVMAIVGIISVLGLLSVILTAICFPKWREDQGHKIFLQMVLALAVNLFLGFVNNFVAIDTKGVPCIVIGVVRHYSFLAMFFWMMVLSGLQVKRLTSIAGAKATTHLILKVSAIAWGLPLIPIVVLLAWDMGFYKSEVTNRGYCYPEGDAFQATVQAPAALILAANLVIFVVILNHIYGWCKCNADVEVRKHTTDDRAAQLRNLGNSIFVFFLFGFTWTFHFLSEEGVINSEFLFEFMFLITASFHLCMLALFFIVLDRKTRKLWVDFLF